MKSIVKVTLLALIAFILQNNCVFADNEVTTPVSTTTVPSITVTSPNGGETYTPGQTITITWTTQNIPADAVMSVVVQPVSNPMAQIGAILVDNTGSAQFELPLTTGTDYKAIVNLGVTTPIKDTSDTTFTIAGNPPAPIVDTTPAPTSFITVTSPGIGETHQVGTDVTVTWSTVNIPATDLVNINIYSHLGTAAVLLLTPNGTVNDGTETFTIPYQWHPDPYYSFSVSLVSDHRVSGYSNTFAVTPNATITVTSPNGGETFIAGQPMTITWSTTGLSSHAEVVPTLFSRDADGQLIEMGAFTVGAGVSNLSGSSTLPISANVPSGNNYVIELVAYESQSPTEIYRDVSDATFSITTASVVTTPVTIVSPLSITNPVNNSDVSSGFTLSGTKSTGITEIGVHPVFDNDNSDYTITLAHSTDGSCTFPTDTTWTCTLANNMPIGLQKIRVQGTGPGPVVYAEDNIRVNVTVSGPTQYPYYVVKVYSPSGGEIFPEGAPITVTWNTRNIPTSTPMEIAIVDLNDFSSTNSSYDLTPFLVGGGQLLNSGQATFTLPTVALWPLMQYGKSYKVSVQRATLPDSANGQSDGVFTLSPVTTNQSLGCTQSSAPSVKLLSPNGGETYVKDQQIPITWETCNVPALDMFTIRFLRYDSNNQLMENDAAYTTSLNTPTVYNTGSTTTTMPLQWGGVSSLPPGAYYKFALVHTTGTIYSGTADMSIYDESDAVFSLTDPVLPPVVITSLSPVSSTNAHITNTSNFIFTGTGKTFTTTGVRIVSAPCTGASCPTPLNTPIDLNINSDGNGNWSVQNTTTIPDGNYIAYPSDEAGDGPTPFEFTLDTVAPSAPIITSPLSGPYTGNSPSLDISGTCNSGNEVHLAVIDSIQVGITNTVAPCVNDAFILHIASLAVFNPVEEVLNFPMQLAAVQVDEANNTSDISNVLTISAPVKIITSSGSIMSGGGSSGGSIPVQSSVVNKPAETVVPASGGKKAEVKIPHTVGSVLKTKSIAKTKTTVKFAKSKSKSATVAVKKVETPVTPVVAKKGWFAQFTDSVVAGTQSAAAALFGN